MTDSHYRDSMVKLSVEFWRLLRSYERVVSVLPPDNKLLSVARNAGRKLQSILEASNMTVVSYEGQEYSPNLAVSLINSDEFEATDSLRIAQMIEPTLMSSGEVVLIGKAIAVKI